MAAWLGAAAHEKDQGQEAEKDDGEEPVVVAEGQHFGLAQHFLIEPGHGLGGIPPLPVGPQIRQGLRQALLPVVERLGKGGEVLHQATLMELTPPGQEGGGRGDAERTPQVAHQVEDAGGVAHFLLGDAGHGEGGEGYEGGPQAKPLDEPGPPGVIKINAGGVAGS